MKKRVGAALIGFMLVMSGCGAAPETAAPVSVSPSPSMAASTTPAPAAQTATPTAAATPAAATTAPATPVPAASSTPQPSAAAATPSAAAATAAPPPVSATAKPTPVPTPTPAPASAAPTPSEKPQATDAGVTTAAQALFKDNCMSCHGAGLEGDFGPNLTKVGSRKTKDEIVQQINKGSGDMPPFQKALKAEEIETLAAWLAAKK